MRLHVPSYDPKIKLYVKKKNYMLVLPIAFCFFFFFNCSHTLLLALFCSHTLLRSLFFFCRASFFYSTLVRKAYDKKERKWGHWLLWCFKNVVFITIRRSDPTLTWSCSVVLFPQECEDINIFQLTFGEEINIQVNILL